MNTYNIRKRIIRDLSIPPKHICCYHGKQITDDMILYDLTDKEILDLWDTIIKCQFNKGLSLKMKNFTKSDLKNRMVVEDRKGRLKIYIDGILLGDETYSLIGDYNEDLMYGKRSFSELDIVKVYEQVRVCCYLYGDNLSNLSLIWQREEVKEVTMTEVEEKFGCKVKIVNDKNT